MFFLFVKFAPLAPENIREPHFAQLQFFFFFKSTTVCTLICMQKTINSFNFKNLHHLSENIREPHLADLQFFLFKSTIVHWSACTKQSMVFIWKICTKCTWKYQGALFSRPAKAFQKLKLGLPTYFFAQWLQQLREKLANLSGFKKRLYECHIVTAIMTNNEDEKKFVLGIKWKLHQDKKNAWTRCTVYTSI